MIIDEEGRSKKKQSMEEQEGGSEIKLRGQDEAR